MNPIPAHYEEVLREVRNEVIAANKELTVPAAEYVPAIPASWEHLDKALTKLDSLLGKEKV